MAYSSRLEIIIDSRSAEQQARDTEQALEALEDAGIRASRAADRVGDESKGAARDMRKLESRSKGVSSELNSMRLAAAGAFAAIGAFATSQLIGGVIRASDGLAEMQGQLRLVEGSAEAAAESYAALLAVSNETRSAMDSTVTLYTKLKRGTDQLNLSNQQLFDLTAAINNSFIVSGASAEEAANAIRQLSQGLASGALRGEEYNAIAENSPRLTRALAESLDMTIGELREFAAEGGITSRVIADSLLSQVEALNDEAELMPRTIGQAMTQFTNDVNNAVARADMSPFIDALDDLRAIVTDPGFQQAMVNTAAAIASMVGLAAEGAREFATMGNQLGTLAAKATGASNELQDINDKIMRLESMRGGSFLARGGLFDFGEGLDTYISDEDIDRYIASLKARRDEIVGEVNGNGNTDVIELPPMTITPPDPGESEASKKAAKAAIAEAERQLKAFESLRDRLRPVEASQEQYAAEQALIRQNAALSEQAALLADLNRDYRNAENAAEVYGFTGEASMEKVSDAARDLGFTFESAFENAIIEGEGFREVLGGILDDITRIILRQNVSKPLGTAIAGIDFAGLFGFAEGGHVGFANGGYTGSGSKMDPAGIVHAGEFVVRKSVVEQPGVLPMLSNLNKGYANGGYVGPASSQSTAPPVNVYISTPPGTESRTEERQNAQGGRDLHVIIDEITAGNISNPGSRTGRAMRTNFGAQRTLTGR
ncbi:MAG TPA: tape measure protein [Modicisalibacter sp.]|nr:tape measure protein [Modicisalibacter sp.]